MGAWGFYDYPSEPNASKYPTAREEEGEDIPPRSAWEEMADIESYRDFVDREISYADAMAEVEEITTDEGGWGVESAWE